MSHSVTHIWAKPLSDADNQEIRCICARYEHGDGDKLRPIESEKLVVVHIRDIRRKGTNAAATAKAIAEADALRNRAGV